MLTNREKMLEAVRICLQQGECKNLSDGELARCFEGRAAEPVFLHHSKEFRETGEMDAFKPLGQLELTL